MDKVKSGMGRQQRASARAGDRSSGSWSVVKSAVEVGAEPHAALENSAVGQLELSVVSGQTGKYWRPLQEQDHRYGMPLHS